MKGTQAEASLELCELPTQRMRVGEEQGFQCPVYPKLAKRPVWDLVLPTRATLVLSLMAE